MLRCKKIAFKLSSLGYKPIFLCLDLPQSVISILEVDYTVVKLPLLSQNLSFSDKSQWSLDEQTSDCNRFLSTLVPDLLSSVSYVFVDHYSLDHHWETACQLFISNYTHDFSIVCIDDLANRIHNCNYLIDTNYFGASTHLRYQSLVPTQCTLLLGPEFAFIDPSYLQCNTKTLFGSSSFEIFIFFGGSDFHNLTLRVLNSIIDLELSNVYVTAVVGSQNASISQVMDLCSRYSFIRLLSYLPTLSQVLSTSNLYIGAGGSTIWEALYYQLSCIVISTAYNQQEIASCLHTDHFVDYLGSASSVSNVDIMDSISRFVHLKNNSIIPRLVDGFGLDRVAYSLQKRNSATSFPTIDLKNADLKHKSITFLWANDPKVRQASFNSDPISFDSHLAWYISRINDPTSFYFIAYQSDIPFGQVRFELYMEPDSYLISFLIDSFARGRSLAVPLLTAAIQKLLVLNPHASTLTAFVKKSNASSNKVFSRLGFCLSSAPQAKYPDSNCWVLHIDTVFC